MGSSGASSMGSSARTTDTPRTGVLGSVSTPTAFWACLVVIVAGTLLVGAIAARAATLRRDAVDSARTGSAQLLDDAESLHVALADADAVASSTFLRAGMEPETLRARYATDILQAGQALAAINANRGLTVAEAEAAARIGERLAVYAELVATARTNNRLGFAVGAAYQRRASDVMQNELLPAATNLYESAARQLDADQRAGTSRTTQAGLVIAGAVVCGVLVIVHTIVSVRTRRVLNLGLCAAALLVGGLCATAIVRLEGQRDAILRSRSEGSDPMLVLSTTRILALRSVSDANLDLIERGTVPEYAEDFDRTTASIGDRDGGSGLLALAKADATDRSARARIDSIIALYADFLDVHDRVAAMAARFEFAAATELAVGARAEAGSALDQALGAEIERARHQFDVHVDEAAGQVERLPLILFVIALVAGACAVGGMTPRIREYR